MDGQPFTIHHRGSTKISGESTMKTRGSQSRNSLTRTNHTCWVYRYTRTYRIYQNITYNRIAWSKTIQMSLILAYHPWQWGFSMVFPLTPLAPLAGCDDRTAAGAVLPKCWTGDMNRSVAHLVWDASWKWQPLARQHCNRKSTCLDMDVSKDDVYIYRSPNGNVNRENDDYQLGFWGTMCSDMPV